MPELLAGDGDLGRLSAVLAAGGLAVIPTDTVYGLAFAADDRGAHERMLGLKGRDPQKPVAVAAASLEALLAHVLPGADALDAERLERLLPGPVTLIVANPDRRFGPLCGAAPERIGVRVPAFEPRLRAALEAVGAFALTSANRSGRPDPRSIDELDPELLAAVDVVVDAGRSPGGAASTVVDISGAEPVVLREGLLSAAAVAAALAGGTHS